MQFLADSIYHVYNRGNNSNKIFFRDENYLFFLKKMKLLISPHCHILALCLMPNHFHFLIATTEQSIKAKNPLDTRQIPNLNYGLGILLSSYAQAINKQESRTGSLFQQKTKAKLIESDSYAVNCMHYIHQNAYKACLAPRIEDWPYSSFSDYAGLRNGNLCNKQLLLDVTGYNLSSFLDDSYKMVQEQDNAWLF